MLKGGEEEGNMLHVARHTLHDTRHTSHDTLYRDCDDIAGVACGGFAHLTAAD